MKILVFIKQVPETDGVRLDPKTGTLNRDNVPGIMNPYDAHAVEAALQLRERHGGSVHTLSHQAAGLDGTDGKAHGQTYTLTGNGAL